MEIQSTVYDKKLLEEKFYSSPTETIQSVAQYIFLQLNKNDNYDFYYVFKLLDHPNQYFNILVIIIDLCLEKSLGHIILSNTIIRERIYDIFPYITNNEIKIKYILFLLKNSSYVDYILIWKNILHLQENHLIICLDKFFETFEEIDNEIIYDCLWLPPSRLLPIVTKLLTHKIKPNKNFIKATIQHDAIHILRLFDQYKIDIKNIVEKSD